MILDGHAPTNGPDPATVLTRAVFRAAEQLGIAGRKLATVLGVSPASLSHLGRTQQIRPENKEGELALLFLRVFRSLDALLGRNSASCRAWLRSHNHHLAGMPAELIQTVPGIVNVAAYLDRMLEQGQRRPTDISRLGPQ